MITSLTVGSAGTAILGISLTVDGSYLALLPGLVALGAGQGAAYTVMFGAATAGAPAHQQGFASAVASTAQQIGGAVGLAVLVAIANARTNGVTGAAATDGLRAAILIAAAGIAVTALVAFGFTAPPRRTSTPPILEHATA
jgi:hypothetical protein